QALCRDALLKHIDAADFDSASAWLQKAGNHLHGRGLPGAVRPQKAQHLTRFDPERDLVDSGKVTKPSTQTRDLDHAIPFSCFWKQDRTAARHATLPTRPTRPTSAAANVPARRGR